MEFVEPGVRLHRLLDGLFFEIDRALHLVVERSELLFAFAHLRAQCFERFSRDERRAIEPAGSAEGEDVLPERRRVDAAFVDARRIGVRVLPRRDHRGRAPLVFERAAVLDFARELVVLLGERRLDRGFGRSDLLTDVTALPVLVRLEILRVAVEVRDVVRRGRPGFARSGCGRVVVQAQRRMRCSRNFRRISFGEDVF